MSIEYVNKTRAFLTTALAVLFVPGLSNAQLLSPSYTAEQAANGKAAYDLHCASCHGQALSDGEFGPPLTGSGFLQRWGGQTLDERFLETARTMPTAAPGSLSDQVYADILAYMLQNNGVSPDREALAADPRALSAVLLPSVGNSPSGGLAAVTEIPLPPESPADPLATITPVTEEMLVDAPDGDWLTWRRTHDGSGFSPLTQINKDNVSDLGFAWSWSLPAGPSLAPPLVHDGVMFVHGWGDNIQALDAVTGRLLWQYTRWLPGNITPQGTRGISIYGQYLYLPTSDAHMVALNVKTGTVVWDQAVGDYSAGLLITGGPLVAQGKVMVGTSGSQVPGGPYIVALDAMTGEELWRFHTIARPVEPGGDTWNGLTLDARSGASVWNPGSYDPELGLAYFGTGQTYDTGPLLEPVQQPGVTNDALYTDTTLALDPDTGELAWHFQHLPNDQWDLDWAFERVLMRLPVDGFEKTVVVSAGKSGVHDLLEADSGQYVASVDPGMQNFITAINPETGRRTIDPERLPRRDEAVMVCPHADGTKNWIPSAYNPQTKMLYVPLMEICMDLVPVPEGERAPLTTGVRWTGRPRPDSDGKYGRLQAINLETRELAWANRQRAPRTNGLLTTAGGLVFSGDLDRYFSAYDGDTGDELWRVRLNDVSNSASVSYMVDGKQYVAVAVGHNRLSQARRFLVPEIRLPAQPAATVWVFALP